MEQSRFLYQTIRIFAFIKYLKTLRIGIIILQFLLKFYFFLIFKAREKPIIVSIEILVVSSKTDPYNI